MLPGYGAVTQALLGTLFTWGLTALGAGCVIFIRGKQRKLLDVSLGFAAGVMTAASYWSLLDPAISMCKESTLYGSEGQYAFIPVACGFFFGAIFVYGTDKSLDYLGISSTNMMISITKSKESKEKLEDLEMMRALNGRRPSNPTSVVTMDSQGPTDFADCINNQHTTTHHRRRGHSHGVKSEDNGEVDRRDSAARALEARQSQWKRIMLLVVAITVHNIPEGLAVGVSFGAAAASNQTSFYNARNLAIGIGIQNFPEGLAVSLPLQAAGFSVWRAFWNHGIPPIHQLLLTLRFYALGTMLVSVADFIGVSKSSAGRIVENVSAAIAALYPKYIYIKDNTQQAFYNIAGFPRVLGAVDCTHISIQSPDSSIGEEFRNRKGYYSLNVQCVCDAHLLFMNVVARWPGSSHDATIFNNTELRAQCESGVYGNRWLIGDSGYGCKSYLLTPVLEITTTNEELYNKSHVKTRNPIERYGQLSGMVEPVFGVLGAVAVAAAQPALPYALAFAAGAMIYVVADDIIPEANASGNGKLATWGCIVGFLVMMCLDVGLG